MIKAKVILGTGATALFLGTLIFSSPARGQTEPPPFQPPGHKFAVRLPTKPVHKRRSTSTAIGKVWTDVWGSQAAGGDFSIAITDLPSVALWFNSNEDLLEQAQEKMVEELGAQQPNLRSFYKGAFKQRLDYVVPAQGSVPKRRGRAWFALFDDKLVVVTGLVPAASADADLRLRNIRPLKRR